MDRRLLLKSGTAFIAAIATPFCDAQSAYPNRPIKMIVPHGPGTSPDVGARLIADKLAIALGQPVVIDNRVGAGGMIGAEVGAASPADGYSLLFSVKGVLAIGPHLHPNAKYDVPRDFRAVSEILQVPHVITATPNTPYNSKNELVEYAKHNPGKINYASTGPGSQPHVAMGTLSARPGIRLNHIPYKGSLRALGQAKPVGQPPHPIQTVPILALSIGSRIETTHALIHRQRKCVCGLDLA